jgi:two-component sensor histidine kinase
MITRELSHRIKNIFASVSGLLSVSARHAADAVNFARIVNDRIRALSVAHSFVDPQTLTISDLAGDTGERTLQGLIAMLLSPYADAEESRVLIEGCDMPLDATAATSLALFVHELATNSLKYGALSTTDGVLHVHLKVDREFLSMTWTERGGPPIAGVPHHSGFGSLLLRVTAQQLKATVDRQWRTDGLTVEVALDMNVLMPRRPKTD